MSLRGDSGWQATHQKAFGKQRWPGLLKALRSPVSHVALVNRFLGSKSYDEAILQHKLKEHPFIPLVAEAEGELPEGGDDCEGLLMPPMESATSSTTPAAGIPPVLMQCYFLDGASVLAALAVSAKPGDSVLDLCAAPGGKSLVLATSLLAAPGAPAVGGRLVCNDSSKPRALRLQRVLSTFLPQELLAPGGKAPIVSVTSVDAATGNSPVAIQRLGPYDRILVDAPCSSDRHLARQGGSALAHWASGAVKANAERQLELLRCVHEPNCTCCSHAETWRPPGLQHMCFVRAGKRWRRGEIFEEGWRYVRCRNS